MYDRAERFKINRKTVGGVRRHAGAQIRGLLTTGQAADAVRLYVAGLSLAWTAMKLGMAANTVRAPLLERGV